CIVWPSILSGRLLTGGRPCSSVTEVVTQRQNHAFDAVYGATDEEISAVDGILVVGGDGLFNEVLNGLAKRRHHAPPCIHPSRLSSARLSLPPSSPLSSTPPPLASTASPAARSSATPSSVKSSPPTSTDDAGGAVPTGGAAAAPPVAAVAATDDVTAAATEGLFANLGARSDGGQSSEEDGERDEARGCGNAVEGTIEPDTQLGAGAEPGTAECVKVGLHLPHALRIGIIPAGSTDCIIMSVTGSRDPTTAALHVFWGTWYHMPPTFPHLSPRAAIFSMRPIRPPPRPSVTGSRDPTTAALHVVLGHRMPLDVARITTWKEGEQPGQEDERSGKEVGQSAEEKGTQHISTEAQGQWKEGQQAEMGEENGGSGGREEGGDGDEEHVREGDAAGDGRAMAGRAGRETEGDKAKAEEEEEEKEGVEVRYAASFFGYGFYGDVIRRSEGLRWMGPARYDYAGLMTYLHHRSYDAEVSYFDVHSSAGPVPRPAIQASPVQAAGLDASPFAAAGSEASAVPAAAVLGESPSQGVLASPLEPGPVRGLERSFTEQLPRTPGLDEEDEEEEVGEVVEEVVEEGGEEGQVGGEGLGEDGEGKGEDEGMPLQAVEWNGKLRRRTFSSPMLVKTRTDLSQLARSSHSQLTLDSSALDPTQALHNQSGAATSAPVLLVGQEAVSEKGQQRGGAGHALGGTEGQGEGLRPCWRTVRGKFHSVGAAVMSCRNDKAPDGVAAQAHLADGNLHLILIRKCSRPEYLQ
ncbi:unnamed protein product, partial [Closterium sp. Naga37s-1]